MIFWSIAGALTVGVLVLILLPLLRRPRPVPAGAMHTLTVYREQLAEIERELRRGEIGAEQAAAARLEVERRLLALAGPDATPSAAPSLVQSAPHRVRALGLPLGLALSLPLAAAGLYLYFGAPGEPSVPFAERAATAQAGESAMPDLAQSAERLAARLAAAPDDRDGWLLLARTYGELTRFDAAAQAYGQAIAHGFDDAEVHAALGEALTAAAGGLVVPEARRAFAAALERDPAEPRAIYYAGLALAQDGRMQEAVDAWAGLLRRAPPQAPWRDFVASQVRQAAGALGIAVPPEAAEAAPAAPPDNAAPGPSAADIEAAGELSAEERAAFIRSMVTQLATRLETQPDDLNGWLRLARAYGVLREPERAAQALSRAETLVQGLPAEAPERLAVEAARQALKAQN